MRCAYPPYAHGACRLRWRRGVTRGLVADALCLSALRAQGRRLCWRRGVARGCRAHKRSACAGRSERGRPPKRSRSERGRPSRLSRRETRRCNRRRRQGAPRPRDPSPHRPRIHARAAHQAAQDPCHELQRDIRPPLTRGIRLALRTPPLWAGTAHHGCEGGEDVLKPLINLICFLLSRISAVALRHAFPVGVSFPALFGPAPRPARVGQTSAAPVLLRTPFLRSPALAPGLHLRSAAGHWPAARSLRAACPERAARVGLPPAGPAAPRPSGCLTPRASVGWVIQPARRCP